MRLFFCVEGFTTRPNLHTGNSRSLTPSARNAAGFGMTTLKKERIKERAVGSAVELRLNFFQGFLGSTTLGTRSRALVCQRSLGLTSLSQCMNIVACIASLIARL